MNLRSIDFSKGRAEVVSCGVTYKENIQGLGYERMVKFLEQMPYIGIGMSQMDLMLFVKQCFEKLTSGGDDFKKSYFEVTQMMHNMMKTADESNDYNFLEKNLDRILDFCALFMVRPGEDISVYDELEIEIKRNNWKKDCVMEDFFFLAKKRIPFLQATLKEIHQQNLTKAAIG